MAGRTRETGETGELLVLAELYRRGVLAGQAARGARGIDLLTSTGPTLQVKARRGTGRWVLGQEDRQPAADVIVLVSVGKEHRADEFYVIPRGDLYDFALRRHHAYWATRPDARSGERELVELRDSDSDVKAFLTGTRTSGSWFWSLWPAAPNRVPPSIAIRVPLESSRGHAPA